jgi:hypothetical protein
MLRKSSSSSITNILMLVEWSGTGRRLLEALEWQIGGACLDFLRALSRRFLLEIGGDGHLVMGVLQA